MNSLSTRFTNKEDLFVWLEEVVKPLRVNKQLIGGVPFTPTFLIEAVFNRISQIKDRVLDTKILVLYTVEMVLFLKWLGFRDVTLATLVWDPLLVNNSQKYGYEYILLESVKNDMKKFDVIVGNPPYQMGDTGSNKTLFDQFYYLATKHCTGTVAFVAPTMWLTSAKKSLVKLREHLMQHGLYEITELNSSKTFGVMVNMLGISYQNVSAPSQRTTYVRLDGSRVVFPNDGSAPVLSGNQLVHSILEKVSSTGTTLDAHNSQLRGVGKDGTCENGEANATKTNVHKFKMINKVNGGIIQYAWTKVPKNVHKGMVRVVFGDLSSRQNLGTVTVLKDVDSTTSRSVVYIPVPSEAAGKSLKSYLDSKIFSFVLPLRRPGTNNAKGILRQISHPPFDRIWTDKELYKHFKLTKEEIKLVEDSVK